MLFNSFDYVVFLTLVFACFWALEPSTNPLARALLVLPPLRRALRRASPPRGDAARPFADSSIASPRRRWLSTTRTGLLLLASYVFYMSWSSVFIVLIISSTLIDYTAGLALGRVDHSGARKGILAVSLIGNLGLLGLFKYADFGLVATAQTLGIFGVQWEPELLDLILPAGISFYTFQTLSYTIDVYRRRIAPCRDILEFATYVAFFPQLVAGPIVRAKEFLPQFRRPPRLTATGAQSAIYLILRGLVKKVAIADFLGAQLIDRVFDNPGAFSSGEVWVAIYGYTWQLYGDFSGYTDIARGSARLVGFELPENFDRPFNTTGPIEFWRAWHVTLSRWVQDYIYIPLGGSQGSTARTYANLFVSFLLIGVWHGAGWTFVIFGLWHAFGVTINRGWRQLREMRGLTNRPPSGGWKRAVLVIISLHFFVIHWPIFRAPSLANMSDVYSQMFAGDWASMRVGPWVWAVILGMGVVHFCPRPWVDAVEKRIVSAPWPLLGLLVVGVAALLMRVSAGQASPFIYFQF